MERTTQAYFQQADLRLPLLDLMDGTFVVTKFEDNFIWVRKDGLKAAIEKVLREFGHLDVGARDMAGDCCTEDPDAIRELREAWAGLR